ncbi:MAG: hypothetical protein EB054_03980, partial [Actinobacteria bacterium]|nr:hypothetical protein [Actinomycetota bacterium]
YIDFTEIKRFLIASHIFIFVFSIGIALVAGGELLSSNLDFVGALWWLMPIAITLESALGLSLAIGIPLLISRVKASRAEI